MPKRSRKWRGQQASARGRADQRERRKIDPDRARGGAFADHQVELELFQSRVEDLFDCRAQPVDFVDEQHVARLQIGELGREVAGPQDHGPRGHPEADPELGRDDLRERGLAEAGGAGEEHVIERLPALPCGRDEHAEIGAQLRLADELGQPLRPISSNRYPGVSK